MSPLTVSIHETGMDGRWSYATVGASGGASAASSVPVGGAVGSSAAVSVEVTVVESVDGVVAEPFFSASIWARRASIAAEISSAVTTPSPLASA